jgi:hypothetical protein
MFVLDKPFQPNVMSRSSLLGPFINYKEDDFILFVTYEWAQ